MISTMLRTVSCLSAAFDATVGGGVEVVEVEAGVGAGGGVLKSVAISGGAVGLGCLRCFGRPVVNGMLIGGEVRD